jgi:C4-dicarboxylate-specific signal transduction histidine kinase
MHISEFDLGALIRQVSDLYHAQDPRVAFGLSLDPKAAPLEADPGRIRQLLNNLLTNSLEALDGRENPVIMIETQRVGDQIALTVIDNGPGFQGGLLEQAFDPYVTSKPKGTGLGPLPSCAGSSKSTGGRSRSTTRRRAARGYA